MPGMTCAIGSAYRYLPTEDAYECPKEVCPQPVLSIFQIIVTVATIFCMHYSPRQNDVISTKIISELISKNMTSQLQQINSPRINFISTFLSQQFWAGFGSGRARWVRASLVFALCPCPQLFLGGRFGYFLFFLLGRGERGVRGAGRGWGTIFY